MAPNKFEKHIQKQLEEREITPSSNAWERLSDKLETSAPQQKKKGYFWYGIAASFIGILIVSIMYFNSESSVTNPDVELVDTKLETPETKVGLDNKIETKQQEVVVENNKTQTPSANDLKVKEKIQTPEPKNLITTVKESEIGIANAEVPNKSKEEILQIKILEIVAAVDSLEQDNTTLTNAEVDSLLRSAQDEILRDKLFEKNGSVDAMALLTEAEDELDKSFRDQIFDSLKSGFLKVRTAVADRNK